MEEVYRSSQASVALIHRVVTEDGKYHVEFPEVDADGKILDWNYVGGGPGLPTPTYDSLEQAKAFIEGLEEGIQGFNTARKFTNKKEQTAYDEGLRFGLEL